jgi:chemotaxis protein methyltransferase CheR
MSEQCVWAVMPDIRPKEFAALRELLHGTFGLDLREGKERLVTARLSKYLRSGGFTSWDAYLQHVRADRSGERLIELVDAMTTNHTSFLREPEHFRFLTTVIAPALQKRASVTVWSAASSTGEEPYSILFTLAEAFQGAVKPELRLIGTDISTRVLRAAQAGVYSLDRLQTLPPAWLQKYFVLVDRSKSSWQVRPEWRARTEFRRLNLTEPLPTRGPYPVVFCRNVMIYFDKRTQAEVVRKLEAVLEPGGYLMVGHSESLTGLEHSLEYVRPAVYRRRK